MKLLVSRAFAVLLCAALPGSALAQCLVQREGVFAGATPAAREQVRQARGSAAGGTFALFRAPLAVNTDGAPNSYHPGDPEGHRLAINAMINGVSIRRDGVRLRSAAYLAAFAAWRDAGYPGYRPARPGGPCGGRAHSRFGLDVICWTNVIASRDGRPCVFRAGSYAGYFGSLTAVRNRLSGTAAGECQANDQLDLRMIPAVVLRGGAANPLHDFGTRTEDLAIAINPRPASGGRPIVVAAIVGDTGDANRIGEGGVGLNMRLLERAAQPRTYVEAVRLDTRSQAMIVATLPGSRSFRPQRPYTAANIEERLEAWARANGYGSVEALAAAVQSCAGGL